MSPCLGLIWYGWCALAGLAFTTGVFVWNWRKVEREERSRPDDDRYEPFD